MPQGEFLQLEHHAENCVRFSDDIRPSFLD